MNTVICDSSGSQMDRFKAERDDVFAKLDAKLAANNGSDIVTYYGDYNLRILKTYMDAAAIHDALGEVCSQQFVPQAGTLGPQDLNVDNSIPALGQK